MERSCRFDVDVTEEDIETFSRLTGDRNPLHSDPDYAKTTQFGRPIAHGAFLVGLVSRALGMHVPGQRGLILSMRVDFPKPLYFPGRVRVEAELVGFSPDRGAGTTRVTITDAQRLWKVLTADVIFALQEPAA